MAVKNLLEENKPISLKDRFSSVTAYSLSALLAGVLLLTAVYVTTQILSDKPENLWLATCDIRRDFQVDCFPGQNATYDTCLEAGCCWDELGACFHSVPARHGYYSAENSDREILPRRPSSVFGSQNLPLLYPRVHHIHSDYVILDLWTQSPQENSQIPSEILPESLTVKIHSPEFSFTVTRLDSAKSPLITTALGPLIVTNSYWEWTVYFGELRTLYAFDSTVANETTNWLYNNALTNKIPSFLGIAATGEAIGCYLPYRGPMEIQIKNYSNLVIMRGFSIPERISLHIFASSSPETVVRQLFEVLRGDGRISRVNEAPGSVPVWSLGPHICPLWSNIEDSVKNDGKTIVEVIKSTLGDSDAPWDSHCVYREFFPTLDKILTSEEMEILKEIRESVESAGKRLIPHLIPMILADSKLRPALEAASLLLKNSSGTYAGLSSGETVVYPDWTKMSNSVEQFDPYLLEYLDNFGPSKVVFIRDAWPQDSSNSPSNFPQFDYMPEDLRKLMTNQTLPPLSSSSGSNPHYKNHNEYADKFRVFLQSKTYALISGDVENVEGWSGLSWIIAKAVTTGPSGHLPPVMMVCGKKVDQELCTRWYGAAVVFPHILVLPENFPGGQWLNAGTSDYAKILLKLRSSLITYQRTAMMDYHNSGAPIVAPTYFHYPREPQLDITDSNQFIWGRGLLIGLVTTPQTRQIHMQIPGDDPWRHLHGGVHVNPTNGTRVSIAVMEEEIVILVRPGHVIPIHESVVKTAEETGQTDIQLLANPICRPNCLAHGQIGFEPGLFADVNVNATHITLGNLSMVRSRIDCATSNHQSTVIKSLTILGGSSAEIDVDFCLGNEDTIEIKYS